MKEFIYLNYIEVAAGTGNLNENISNYDLENSWILSLPIIDSVSLSPLASYASRVVLT